MTVFTALAVAAAVTTSPIGAEAAGHSIVEPRLMISPTDAELWPLYPSQAWMHRRGGSSSMLCRVKRNASLTDCRLAAQSPGDQGFGRALLESATYWRVYPRKVDGKVVDNGLVRLSVDWVARP
jgi:periplasmic protein TonB